MDARGQSHIPAASLPVEEPSVPVDLHVIGITEPVWTFRRTQQALVSVLGTEPKFHVRAADSLVTIPTTISHLTVYITHYMNY